MKLSGLLDRMENSTIQALERQVDHLTKEKKRLEDELAHLRSASPLVQEYFDLKAKVERLTAALIQWHEYNAGCHGAWISCDACQSMLDSPSVEPGVCNCIASLFGPAGPDDRHLDGCPAFKEPSP